MDDLGRPGGAAGVNILVAYAASEHPLRSTVEDHLGALGRYSGARCFYLNAAFRRVPRWVEDVPFDLVVFHTSLLSLRWTPAIFEAARQRVERLRGVGRVRLALPQDEFLRPDLVEDFVRDLDVGVVCSVAPESEWERIYPRIDRGRVKLTRVLTGYLDDATIERIDRITATVRDRPVAIGYRAWAGAPWLGRHGTLKGRLATVFEEAAARRGLATDISTADDATLTGDDWFRFLAKCRWTVGVEGGASLLDRDGSIRRRVEEYQAANPGASFDEIEAACFPGADGTLDLVALSPRHLEACATRTCQVLVEGDYNGILEAGVHYVPLRRDLGNLDEVLDRVTSDEGREEMVERAYRDVVASGAATYRRFAAEVLEAAGLALRAEPTTGRARHLQNRAVEWLTWRRVAVGVRVIAAAWRLWYRIRPRPAA